MFEQKQNIRNQNFYRYISSKKYLKIFVPGFAFKHDDNTKGKDKFVGREVLYERLYTWLTSDSKSGSYLITGYRGMGKSLLVKRVIDSITRQTKAYKEVLFQLAMTCFAIACYIGIRFQSFGPTIVLVSVSVLLVAFLYASKICNTVFFERNIRTFPFHHLFDKEMLSKFYLKWKDRRTRVYSNITITVNLGQEILNERDVLSLIAQNIKEKYYQFAHNRQSRPIVSFIVSALMCFFSFALTIVVVSPNLTRLLGLAVLNYDGINSWLGATTKTLALWGLSFFDVLWLIVDFSLCLLIFWLVIVIFRALRKNIPYLSAPFNTIHRLNILCDRISSTLNEKTDSQFRTRNSFITFSLFSRNKNRITPMANVREIEHELMGIINTINSEECPKSYRTQFIIVFDELDKITKAPTSEIQQGEKDNNDNTNSIPDFETTVKGFTDAMAYEERKQNVLRLLANMKLFIASVKAKCVFISGHELFDASLADLSDREFAINSIFNGVLNVSSFLSPEREQSDVSSMTEVYLATMLLPEKYLLKKMYQNSIDNLVLKEEQPSLRWYYEYLMELHIRDINQEMTFAELEERTNEIQYAVEFLRFFCVYLSHISNGSPKKISTYFEKYIKTNYDATSQFDWHDEIVVGAPTEKNIREQCVLYFNANDQKLINFIHYVASPVMNAITSEVSHYGDKLLVSTSFMLDQIYKYHGNGFSWRNLEQMPELLNSNKNPELRDSMASIVEFLLQIHITPVSSGVFQYKFHKQISEEISAISKTSEEASALFNFTLNESETVKRYNTRLLWHYMNLSKSADDTHHYNGILERIHENLGDLDFSEEDYYRAIHEYRSALQFITNDITSRNVLAYLKCSLKVGLSYEYRHTYENAYMEYCHIINRLVHLRWVDEGQLGLDSIMRLTKDWRVKQPVLIEKRIHQYYRTFGDSNFVRQFHSNMWEDIKENMLFFAPRYSLDADKAISGLSANYTPEKSDVFLKLTTFEDVKYIYQVILAKLFVTEKMELSGITQSSIDEAEAEFKILHNTTNIEEKFMISADFFCKMAEILYYKNNFVITSPPDSLSAAMYNFDINVWEFLDDYCFNESKNERGRDAISIKDDICNVCKTLKTGGIQNIRSFSSLIPQGDATVVKNVSGYLKYLDKMHDLDEADRDKQEQLNEFGRLLSKMQECSNRRDCLMSSGHRSPCNACKYVNRSLILLLKGMFAKQIPNDYTTTSKAFVLLLYTSHKHLKHLRQPQVSLLAVTSEKMADVMLSCARTAPGGLKGRNHLDDRLSSGVINLLTELSKGIVLEKHRSDIIQNESRKPGHSKLDRVLLYYWAASKYYEIASMYKEAIYCIERILKVLEDYLCVLDSYIRFDDGNGSDYGLQNTKIVDLVLCMFKNASRLVGRQYDNFDMAEIHQYKWLFHLEHFEDIDLSKLSIFPNLQSLFLLAVNCKVYYYRLTQNKVELQKYIPNIYNRVAPALRHTKTFKADVEANYIKVTLNRLVLIDMLGVDVFLDEQRCYYKTGGTTPLSPSNHYQYVFYQQLHKNLSGDQTCAKMVDAIFGNEQAIIKMDIIDFLVVDSIVALSNILKTLTPHNHITTFSNQFTGNVYYLLWEWSKYYEMLYDLYMYYRFRESGDKLNMKKVVDMLVRNEDVEAAELDDLLDNLVMEMKKKGIHSKDNFGYRYTKLLLNIRHEMDDFTIHHIYSNHSAEMAIKFFKAARNINSEGVEYKNMIANMFLLDDDLRNDTCQGNLADERYLLNSEVIDKKRQWIQHKYESSNINNLSSYENDFKNWDDVNIVNEIERRYDDSIYINTEY